MKNWIKFGLPLVAALSLGSCGKQKVEADFNVIPLPQSIVKSETGSFVINDNTKIFYQGDNMQLKKTAELLAGYIKEQTGKALSVTEGTTGTNAIILRTGLSTVQNKEAYELTVTNEAIWIDGVTPAGTFYGVQTLRKSIPAKAVNLDVSLPLTEIKDYPRFAYRGMHLDVGRHFFNVDSIKRYIDILALHNVNTMHWHLTEDQGWRIEIKKYPKLTEIGSKRNETVIGHNTPNFDGKPHGGYYTQAEAKEIVAYAADRNITVVPEIDMPGHMLAAMAAYPELGCTGGPYEVQKTWGVFDDVLCAGKESTFQFVEGVLDEICEIFPSSYIHIGGDECPKARWAQCPLCQARIKEEKLVPENGHSSEFRLQSYFITRIEKYLNSKGRRIIGWDEILEGGLAPDATVMSWTGMQGGITSAKEGHDAIMTPGSHCYFDHYQSTDTANEPEAIGGYTNVEKVYNFEPIPSELKGDERNRIIGTQANVWTEYMKTFRQVEYMVMPRIAALSEVQWTMPEKKNYEDFLKRLPRLIAFYDAANYNYAKHLFDIMPELVANTDKGVLDITFKSLVEGDIYYTLDGTDPTEKSSKYTGTFSVDKDAAISAVVIRPSGKSRVFTEKVSINKATFKPITLTTAPGNGYAFKGAGVLVDGLKGGPNYKTGRWVGFQVGDVEAVIDLKQDTEVSSCAISCNVVKGDWIMGPLEFTVSVSENGTDFKQVATKDIPEFKKEDKDGIYDYDVSFEKVKAKYVKVFVKRTPLLPEWHSGAGRSPYVFLDEIILK